MRFISVYLLLILFSGATYGQDRSSWKTNWSKASVNPDEIISGGVPRDGIPPIDDPVFVSVSSAAEWIDDREPVILVTVESDVRAFPLQIMTYHEIVNTTIGEIPVSVTFCPLCYSTIVFKRKLGDVLYDFGVSGLLRHSDLIMYDRQTESLWQQITGEAIVGDMTGSVLESLPSQIVSFEQFARRYPDAQVLSRETGFDRNYGSNPYPGYDDIDDRPFLFRGDYDERLRPMERVVTVAVGEEAKAYPYSVTRKARVINDELGGVSLVVFHLDGAVSALDKSAIRRSSEIGTTGVFSRVVDGRSLTFSYRKKAIVDDQTGSTWDVTGHAIDGELEGVRLDPVIHGNYFSFAWFVFRPDSGVYAKGG